MSIAKAASGSIQVNQQSAKLLDGFYLEFYIDGVSIPMVQSAINISIIENSQSILPTCQFTYNDAGGVLLNKLTLGDGSRLRILLAKDDVSGLTVSDFYTFGAPKVNIGTGSSYVIQSAAIFNALKYLRGKPKRSYTGTSYAVLKKLAEECDLAFDGNYSNDTQTWLNAGNLSYNQLVRNIADHGWYDSKSCFVVGLSEKGVLRYINLSTLNDVKPAAVFSILPKVGKIPNYKILQYSINNDAGLMNNIMGYGSKFVEQDTTGSTYTYDSMDITRFSNYTEMSADFIQSTVDLQKMDYQPFNCGNVHSNYTKAFYQNKRLRSIWSTGVDILVDKCTNLSLFDVVKCDISDHMSSGTNKSYSGEYIIGAKTRILDNGNYYEKLKLVTQGRQNHTMPVSKVV